MEEIVKDYYLSHHGIKGQKWGVRRYQNYDGTLTSAGQRRVKKKFLKSYNQATDQMNRDIIPKINKKYEKYDFKNGFNTKKRKTVHQ